MATKTKKKGLPFSKLSAKAKEKAREWWHDYDPSYDLSDLFKHDLEEHYGISGCKVLYSLNNCQGDGVCFEGRPDMDWWRKHDADLEAKITEFEAVCALMGFEDPSLSMKIEHSGNYYHCHSMRLECICDDPPAEDSESPGACRAAELFRGIEKYLVERIVQIAREMEKSGYAEIDHHNTAEYIDEAMDQYRFARDGEIV